MTAQEYIDELFQDYAESAALRDFKEEMLTNLQDRISDLQKKGLSEAEAREKAAAELGDISEIALQMSLEKRREVYEHMYLGTRSYMDKLHIAGYVLCAALLGFGLIVAAMLFFFTDGFLASLGTLVPFLVVPGALLVFLVLTQETSSEYPMKWWRALLYALAAGVIVFGLVVFTMMFFIDNAGLPLAIAALIPFVLPGAVVLLALGLTEKSRHKPWVVEQQKIWLEQYAGAYSDPHTAARLGLLSGALWIVALGLFIAIGFALSFKYSWIVFLFAAAGELMIIYFLTPLKRD